MSTKVLDFFDSEDDFIQMLEAAEENATLDNEMKFVDDLTTRAKKYGAGTFLSESQYDWLKRIAKM
jgi:hypothetical protein